jgi:hypothetical protein
LPPFPLPIKDGIIEHKHPIPAQPGDLSSLNPYIQAHVRTKEERSPAILQLESQLPRHKRRIGTSEDPPGHDDPHENDWEEQIITGEEQHAVAGLETSFTQSSRESLAPQSEVMGGEVMGVWAGGFGEASMR